MGWEEVKDSPNGIRNLFYISPEAERLRDSTDKHLKTLGLIRDIDYTWRGDDLVVCSQKAKNYFDNMYKKTKELLGKKELPYKKYRNHKIV